MRSPNLFALALVAVLGVRAASAQCLALPHHRVRKASLTGGGMVGAFSRSRHRGACGSVQAGGEGPFPLAVIAHASTQNVLRRA